MGHFEYWVMPLSLTNACAVQALINYMLWDILNQFVFVYLDATLIFSNNPEEQIAHLQHVLTRLLVNNVC